MTNKPIFSPLSEYEPAKGSEVEQEVESNTATKTKVDAIYLNISLSPKGLD